jgi:hypothetical protein
MAIKLEPFGTQDVLLCPACNESSYVTVTHVTVYNRKEDAQTGLVASIDCLEQTMVTSTDGFLGNPSARRHGLTMTVFCENCHTKSSLRVAQHKGQTLLDWTIGQ